jgi:hypothetical protein
MTRLKWHEAQFDKPNKPEDRHLEKILHAPEEPRTRFNTTRAMCSFKTRIHQRMVAPFRRSQFQVGETLS